MIKSLTVLLAAIFISGCAATTPAELPASIAMFLAEPDFGAVATSANVEAAATRAVDDEVYVHVPTAAECDYSEEIQPVRSRCH